MNSKEYREYIMDSLHTFFGETTCRAMFGGHGLYKDGIIFAIIVDDVLYFKVDDTNRADFEARGCSPFTYEAKEKRVSMSYWQVPLEVIEDGTELIRWAKKAYAVSLKSRKDKLNKVNKVLIWKKSG